MGVVNKRERNRKCSTNTPHSREQVFFVSQAEVLVRVGNSVFKSMDQTISYFISFRFVRALLISELATRYVQEDDIGIAPGHYSQSLADRWLKNGVIADGLQWICSSSPKTAVHREIKSVRSSLRPALRSLPHRLRSSPQPRGQ
ncbi:uncharacterized protein LOC113464472 [Ceratina calcarata]|uniref:Uncharacterized protein LOC113464472 n=1 Tax=Ceratina calcarata TaxID=156304 RepID=A0AAJ7S2N0_9HYME|nr:uncharacterized protein LOC113464472 [Ceratina calcarata]